MKNSIVYILIIFLSCGCNSNKSVIEVPIADGTTLSESNIDSPKNIILLIGDGMGLSQISGGMYSQGNYTVLEKFPVVGLQKTHAYDKLITDSAASATAFATGVKTYNGAIAVNPDSIPVPTILEEAEAKNLCTGLVASSTIVHATPASFIAHNIYRRNYEEIAEDFLKTDIDFFIGGGKKFFERRLDERNLLEAFGENYYISHFIKEELSEIELDTSLNFGYLTSDQDPLPVAQGRDYMIPASNMAIEYLDKKSKNGFFLMIEGSQIDWGGHANDTDYIITEFQEFDKIISAAYDYAKADGNTLVIVTADHETGGFGIQSESTMDSIVGAFTSGYHTGTMVPIFAYGPASELFSGIYDNTEIYHKMRQAFAWE